MNILLYKNILLWIKQKLLDHFPDINLTLDALSYLAAINLSFQINFPWISISMNGVMNARNELLSLILHDLLKFRHLTKVLQSKSTSYVECLSITDQLVSVRLNGCQNVRHTGINTISDHCVLGWLFLNALNGVTLYARFQYRIKQLEKRGDGEYCSQPSFYSCKSDNYLTR